MDFFDFSPPSYAIKVGGKPYELGFVTYRFLTEIRRHFGSMEIYQTLIDKSKREGGIFDYSFMSTVSWTVFNLLRSHAFKDLNDFTKTFIKSSEEYYHNVLTLYKVFEDSTPKEKVETVKNSEESSFSKVFVFISRSLNLTVDQFYNLTPRQVDQIQKDLIFFQRQDMEFNSSLHGIKLKPEPSAPVTFNEKEDRELEDYSKKLFERMKNGNFNT